jgi:hypothetical protein
MALPSLLTQPPTKYACLGAAETGFFATIANIYILFHGTGYAIIRNLKQTQLIKQGGNELWQ